MNENDESKMIELRYKELCILQNQLATRASLTPEAYAILKSNIFKSSGDIDESLGKRTTPLENVPKSNVKEKVESRVSTKHTSQVCNKESVVLESNGDALDHSRSTIDGILIRGLKVKEKKGVKSGKRLKSCLEKTSRKTKQKNISVTSSDNSFMSHDINSNSDQNLTNPGNCLSFPASTKLTYVPLSSQLPYLSQLPQEGGFNMSSLSPYYPIQEQSGSRMEVFPAAQLNISPFRSKNDQHTNSSLTQLLQDQMRRQ